MPSPICGSFLDVEVGVSDNYDQSHNVRDRDPLTTQLARPFYRAIDTLRNRVNDLAELANTPVFLDQYPGNTKPWRFSKLYGPIPLTTARRITADGSEGFEANALVANNSLFYSPRNGSIYVNREGAWHWTGTNVTGWVSLSYNADPDFDPEARDFINPIPVSDIYNPAIEMNGGALQENYFFGHVNYATRANIAWDMKLYDRKRARFLHDDALPSQVVTAQNFANKSLSSPTRFDPNTEIEPRIRIQEVRPGSLLDTDTAYDAAQFRAYLQITFFGYKVLAP